MQLGFFNAIVIRSWLSSQMALSSNTLEVQRTENIKRNHALLEELGIRQKPIVRNASIGHNPRPAKRQRLETSKTPSRSSARIASAPARPAYSESNDETSRPAKAGRKKSKAETPVKGQTPHVLSNVPAEEIESLRIGWADWKPSGSPPTRDENSVFHFETHPSFTPNKSPEEIIREGCFGGSYFRPLFSQKLGITVSGDYQELPSSWTSGLDTSKYLTSSSYDIDVNKYKVACGQSIEQWEAAGWINHSFDVRGWFQWYCRFFMGRRCDDDERQVSRWQKCVGKTGRWRRMLLKKYVAMGVKEVFDDGEEEESVEVSPVMHQTCHHWAFEVRQGILDEFWKTS